MLDGPNSTHVVNAISPAFTASFELADHILKYIKLNNLGVSNGKMFDKWK